jgi:DNA-binding protein HU-beta
VIDRKRGESRVDFPIIMIKSDLVEKIQDKTGMLKKDIALVVDAIFDVMTEALKKGDKVKITNFGTFEKSLQEGYLGVHPQTGEPLQIQPFVKVKFTSSSILKKNIR